MLMLKMLLSRINFRSVDGKDWRQARKLRKALSLIRGRSIHFHAAQSKKKANERDRREKKDMNFELPATKDCIAPDPVKKERRNAKAWIESKLN